LGNSGFLQIACLVLFIDVMPYLQNMILSIAYFKQIGNIPKDLFKEETYKQAFSS
jgi:hypothetical protein